MTWNDFITNTGHINAYYDDIPELNGVRLRSINVNWRGPEVVLRIDLPRFPENIPEEWQERSLDTFQCHIKFLAAADIALKDWSPPTTSDITMAAAEQRRLRVTVSGPGVDLRFSCSDSLLVDHASAFRINSDGADRRPHLFVRKIDARLYSELPATYEKRFYATR